METPKWTTKVLMFGLDVQYSLPSFLLPPQNRRDGRGCHPSNLFSRIFSLKRAPGIDTTYTNDIVLVRLQRPVATNRDIHPVRMPGTTCPTDHTNECNVRSCRRLAP